MKNLQTIFQNNSHPNYDTLESVCTKRVSGAYIILGFNAEYGGEEREKAILLKENDRNIFIVSSSVGVVRSVDEGKTWTQVTRLASKKIEEDDIQQGAVKGGDDGAIALDTITDHNIASNAIKTKHISPLAVTSAKIADGAIGTAKIANKAVTKTELANAVVNQIDKFQFLANGTNLLAADIKEGVYLINGYKYTNIPSGVFPDAPALLLVGDTRRLLIGRDKSSYGYPITAWATKGSTSWTTSNPIMDEVSTKQNSTDNTLTTTSKTVVGAINELNSSLGDVSTALTAIIGE